MLEILNSGQYAAPIIVFVNQKKSADMVAKDLQRAGVCPSGLLCRITADCVWITVERSNVALWQEPGAA